MTILINKAFKDIRQKEVEYHVQSERAKEAVGNAKYHARLIMGNPETLGALFAAGAYKGATSTAPKKQRKRALFTFVRTALTSFLH